MKKKRIKRTVMKINKEQGISKTDRRQTNKRTNTQANNRDKNIPNKTITNKTTQKHKSKQTGQRPDA